MYKLKEVVEVIKMNYERVFNLEGAIRGMRNPLESWKDSDSRYGDSQDLYGNSYIIGKKDKSLALKLIKAGTDHRKFMRQILVSMDITAPLCWWKDMDQYKICTTTNSCSTMHKLGSRLLTKEDFSWDELTDYRRNYLFHINRLIEKYQADKTELNFREMIHDLLDSFNQKRTWTGNYEVLRNIYQARNSHKQQEFRKFCLRLTLYPYSEFITD